MSQGRGWQPEELWMTVDLTHPKNVDFLHQKPTEIEANIGTAPTEDTRPHARKTLTEQSSDSTHTPPQTAA